MTQTEHAPLPWEKGKHRRHHVVIAEGCVVADCRPDFADPAGDQDPAGAENEVNAAFIVRACNSHEKLVKALERLIDRCADSTGPVTQALRAAGNGGLIGPLTAEAVAALAEATQGE